MQKKFLIIITILIIASVYDIHPCVANDINVDAFITVRRALSISKTSDMNFGTVEHGQNPQGTINLGTDGTLSLGSGSYDLTLKGNGNSAKLVINGDDNSIIDISCENNGKLNSDNGQSINLINSEISFSQSVFGNGTPCAGLDNPVLSNNFSVRTSPEIYMGAQLEMTGVNIAGDYSTEVADGDPVIIRISYQ